MRITRRTLLIASAAGAAALVSGCGGDPGTVEGRFDSREMAGEVGWAVHYPAGTRPDDHLPVVVILHGRGGSHRSCFSGLHLDSVVDDLHRKGGPALAVAAVDGGDHGYWHRRTDGTDPGAMVAREFVPVLRRRGLDTARLGLYGWSMGGYGALLLTGERRLHPRAVVASSPALFTSAGATAPGAFDSPADFTRHDVFAHPAWEQGVPTRIDIGDRDPFVAAARDYMARMTPPPAGGVHGGGHDTTFWRRWAPAEFAFLGRHLT